MSTTAPNISFIILSFTPSLPSPQPIPPPIPIPPPPP